MSDDLSGDMLAPSWPNLVYLKIKIHGQLINIHKSQISMGGFVTIFSVFIQKIFDDSLVFLNNI